MNGATASRRRIESATTVDCNTHQRREYKMFDFLGDILGGVGDFVGDMVDGIGDFFGSLFGDGSQDNSYDYPDYDPGALTPYNHHLANHTLDEIARLSTLGINSYTGMQHIGISQQELEIHQQQLNTQMQSLEVQRESLGIARQNALDRIAADFQLAQIREEREEKRQEFELNRLELQFLNQYQLQQNEHEFQLARDLTNFEKSVQLAQLNAENAKKLELFRQNCENLRLQKRLEFDIFMFEKRKEFEWKIQEYGRETHIILANINRENTKETAEYQRLLDRHPLSTLVKPTLDFYEQFKNNEKPVPPLVIISPLALEFDPVKNPATEWFAPIEPNLTDNLRDFLAKHYPIESAIRPAKFLNGYKTKAIGNENAVDILHWTHKSIPTLFIESKLSGDRIRLYLGYWEMMENIPHYKKIVEFSRKEILYPLARANARTWQKEREKMLQAGKTEKEVIESGGIDEANLNILLLEEQGRANGFKRKWAYKVNTTEYNEYLLEYLAFCHRVLAALVLDRYYILNYRVRPKLPELLSDLLKVVVSEKFKKQIAEMVVGQYRLLYIALEAQLPNWIPELALDLAASLAMLEDKKFAKQQLIYSITVFLRAKGCKTLQVIDDLEQLKQILLPSDEDYFDKLDRLLRLMDKSLVSEAEKFLDAWFRLIREGHIKRKKYGSTLFGH
jgi:anion-transporting  ArsA/GET3 family ATPase